MASARKQLQGEKNVKSSNGPTARPLSNYDEAVLRVQEWNEALKCEYEITYSARSIVSIYPIAPSRPSKIQSQPRRVTDPRTPSPTPRPHDVIPASTSSPWKLGALAVPMSLSAAAPVISNTSAIPLIRDAVFQQPEEQDDNWDDDFEEGISFTKIQGILSIPIGCA